MDKRGIRRDAPKKPFGKWLGTFVIIVLFLLAIVICVFTFVVYMISAKDENFSEMDNTEVSTAEFNEIFEAYGAMRENMPEVISLMQTVEGRELEVEVGNMLYKTGVDTSFVGKKEGWIAVSLQMRIKNLTMNSMRVVDRLSLLADSVRYGLADASTGFLREYNLRNINNATVRGGQTLAGWVSFYVRELASFNMYMQVDVGPESPTYINISHE